MGSSIVIETTNLCRNYDTRMVVYRLSIQIPTGVVFGLLGPNGAGKSTTIKMITGRIRPTSGHVRVFGLNPWKQRVKINQRLGYLPENPYYYNEMDVFSYCTFNAKLYGMKANQAKLKTRTVLDRLGLGRLETHKVGKLSQGQKQRLGFACAILNDPDLLILDEPTANLDPEGRVYVLNLIKTLRQEDKTILISSHILPEIERICDYIGIMSDGRLLASEKTTDLTRNVFDNEFKIITSNPDLVEQKLHDWAFIKRVIRDDDILIVEVEYASLPDLWSSVPRFCTENNINLKTLAPVRDPLEKVFLSLVNPKQKEKIGEING